MRRSTHPGWRTSPREAEVATRRGTPRRATHTSRALTRTEYETVLRWFGVNHLIKTFYTGIGGWTDQQLPDGTVILTAPTGHIHTTEAHGASVFPALRQPTGELYIPPHMVSPDTDRSAMMPRSKQTRERNRRDRINAERR